MAYPFSKIKIYIQLSKNLKIITYLLMEMCSHTPLIIKQSTIKSREELLGIRETVKHSNNLSQLQPETILKIR